MFTWSSLASAPTDRRLAFCLFSSRRSLVIAHVLCLLDFSSCQYSHPLCYDYRIFFSSFPSPQSSSCSITSTTSTIATTTTSSSSNYLSLDTFVIEVIMFDAVLFNSLPTSYCYKFVSLSVALELQFPFQLVLLTSYICPVTV